MDRQIKLLITDFDGTFVDTFRANYLAYKKAFLEVGLALTEEKYKQCFGLRFEQFMHAVGIEDEMISSKIKEKKAIFYPEFFSDLRINEPLKTLISAFKRNGYKTAIASTASRENLTNILQYFNANDIFDLILTGENVIDSKPSPEIYQKVLDYFGCKSDCAIVFEDSKVGVEAAKAADLNYIVINSKFYGN